MPVNLTYLITGTQYGGATVGMNRILSGLDRYEYNIHVVSLTKSENGVISDLPEYVKFDCIKISNRFEVHRFLPLVKILQNTDFLVCSAYHASLIGVVAGRLLRVPNIATWKHNTTEIRKMSEFLYKKLFQLSDVALADSGATNSLLQNTYGISSSKTTVLPIAGIDTSEYSPMADQNSEDGISVGSVGRLSPEKGFDNLIECAYQLESEYQFHIAGDGNQREWLESHVPENVTLHGRIPNREIPEFLNQHDIYFQPSKTEGLCMTVIEAMSCALPVVASEVGGIPESVVPETTGYLCDPSDIDCFTARLEELGSNPELRREMGTAGRERVINRYSQSVLVEKFEEVVERIAG